MDQVNTIQKDPKSKLCHRNGLESLPSEILNLVTSHINGFTMMALYNCGSSLLNYKLKQNRTVTHFRIQFQTEVCPPYKDWRFCNFRAITKYQSLVSLELLELGGISIKYFTSSIVANLPKTLEILKFEFIEAYTMWIAAADYSSDRKDTHPFEIFQLDCQFPHLRVLELFSNVWDRYSLYRGKHCIPFQWTTELKDKFLSHLPKGLESLSLSQLGSESIGKLLPPSLPALSVCDPIDFSSLSKEMKKLTVIYDEIEASTLPDLPCELEFFEMCRFSEYGGLVRFSCSLKTLIVYQSGDEFDEDAIKALPATLTELRFGKMSYSLDSSIIKYLPQGLKTCILTDGFSTIHDIGPEAFPDLPKSLTILNLATRALPWSIFKSLPPQLVQWTQYQLKPTEAAVGQSPTESLEYWKNQAPKGCAFNVRLWNIPE